MPWEDPELPDDEDEIVQRILAGMRDALPGWEPAEGAPEVAIAEELGRETAVVHARLVEALQLAIAGIGETVFQLVPRVGATATLPDVELTVVPPAGVFPIGDFDAEVTVPAGLTIIAGDVAFVLLEAVTETVTFTEVGGGVLDGQFLGTLHVAMTAATAGTVGNVAADTPVTIVTSTGVVVSASIVDDGAGGVDGETLADYLDRVTDYLSTLRPGAVLAADLAALSRTVSGVHRAIGVDLLDPAEMDPQERTATVFAIDADGQPVDGSTETALLAQLEAAREVNFNVILADPTYTSVAVAVTVVAAVGVDHSDLEDRVTAAIAAFIDPASWGSTEADPRAWVETTVVRSLDLAVVASQVTGVASVSASTVNGGATRALAGPAALPKPLTGGAPSTIAVTVT